MTTLTDLTVTGRATRAEVDQWIDILDRAEPTQTGWRGAFDNLNATLAKARKFRSMGRVPLGLLAISVQIAYVLVRIFAEAFSPWRGYVGGGALVFWAIFLLWEIYMRQRFPVLQMEGRVAALLRYYGAKDLAEEEETY